MDVSRPVRVLIELDIVPDCTSWNEGVRHVTAECRDEIIAGVNDYATMVYFSEL